MKNKLIACLQFSWIMLVLMIMGCQSSEDSPSDSKKLTENIASVESVDEVSCRLMIKKMGINQAFPECLLLAQKGNGEAQYEVAMLMLKKGVKARFDPQSLLVAAAKNSYVVAQRELAKCYSEGLFFERNDYLAFQWYLAAASQQDPEALYQVAISYLLGNMGQEKNAWLGMQYLKLASKKGYYPAQSALAGLTVDNQEINRERFEVLATLRQAAIAGSVDAQLKLAKILMEFSLPQYDKAAFQWVEKAALQHNDEAIYLLANFYLDGIGTMVDYEKAFGLFNQLAQENHHLAQAKLGQMYYFGLGVARDSHKAREYLMTAADVGVTEAINWIAILSKEPIYEPAQIPDLHLEETQEELFIVDDSETIDKGDDEDNDDENRALAQFTYHGSIENESVDNEDQ